MMNVRNLLSLAFAASAFQLAGCQAATDETQPKQGSKVSVTTPSKADNSPPTKKADNMTGSVSGPLPVTPGGPVDFSNDGLIYRHTVMAPDACFVADAKQSFEVEQETVTVKRILRREPGFCAQVLTPVLFTGEITGLSVAPTILILEIYSVEGKLLDKQQFRRLS